MLTKISIFVALVAVSIYFALIYRPFTLKTPHDLNPQYDYIIVGGGTAGSVLAARLSEDPAVSVLLLEAGPDHYHIPFAHVPALAPFLQQTAIDWQYLTEPQQHACKGFVDHQSRWPRGKCLGGTSMLNLMLYSRGNRGDFKHLEELGLTEWSYDNMLPYFMKSEAASIDDLVVLTSRGVSGPLKVKTQSERTAFAQLFRNTTAEMGYHFNEDYINPSSDGFAWQQFMAADGKRVSPAGSYLEPAFGRFNLHVVTNAHVKKVLFLEANRAAGVEYFHNDQTHRVLTNREIILAAGAVGSPQLLMLSGIGPKAELEKHFIPLVADNPNVGQNLIDHMVVDLAYGFNESIGYPQKELLTPLGAAKALFNYATSRSGPLAQNPFELTGFFKSGLQEPAYTNDIQVMVASMEPTMDTIRNYVNLDKETFDATYGAGSEFAATAAFAVVLTNPHSRGEIKLRSSDPLAQPLINPRYLENDNDVQVILRGLQMMRLISQQNAFLRYNITSYEKTISGCKHLELMSNEYLQCLIRHRAYTAFHPMGTCRMGLDPSTSVVDPRLRVNDVTGLRVVDASIFPVSITGPPSAVIVAAAEKASSMILEDFAKKRESDTTV